MSIWKLPWDGERRLLEIVDGSLLALTVSVISSGIAIITALRFRRSSSTKLGELTDRVRTVERSRKGAVVCDYVDAGTLSTLAAQYSVAPRPDEIERAKQSKAGINGQLDAGVKLGVNGETSDAMRALYRIKFDPHMLSEDVLRAVESDGALRQDLIEVPAVGLEELKRIAKPDSGLVAVERVWQDTVVEAKLRQFEKVQQDEYLLVEAEWKVVRHGSGMLNLMLRRLRSQDKDVDMPDEINVCVPSSPRRSGTWSTRS